MGIVTPWLFKTNWLEWYDEYFQNLSSNLLNNMA